MPKMWATIEFEAPVGASNDDIRDFIKEWLESGGGCRHPDDPLFGSLGNVKVAKLQRLRESAKK